MIKALLTVLGFSLCVSQISGQHVITGKITDRHRNPLAGAAIVEKGTTNGVSANVDGEFKLIVAEPNSILNIYVLGYRQQEININRHTYLEITLKEDCNVCFFDGKQIGFYLKSGLLKTPGGGALTLSYPAYRQTIFLGKFSYQTNFGSYRYLKGEFGLAHLIVKCDYNADVRVSYRDIAGGNNSLIKTYAAEATIDLSTGIIFPNHTTFQLGYGQTDALYRKEDGNSLQDVHGYLLGLGTYIGKPFQVWITGKSVYWKHYWEWQADIEKRFKSMSVSAQFLRIDSFKEFTLTAGMRVNYYRRSRH